MKLRALAPGIVVWAATALSAHAQPSKADAAAKLLVNLCVGGGSITITKSTTAQDRYNVGSSTRSVVIETREATGLVDGINKELNELSAEQANRARNCMRPYVDRLMNLALGSSNVDVNDLVKQVTFNVNWRKGGAFSKYEYVGDYSYIYKNYSASSVTCRFVATGILRDRETKDVHRKFQRVMEDFSLSPGATREVRGAVGVEDGSDDDYVVSMTSDLRCW